MFTNVQILCDCLLFSEMYYVIERDVQIVKLSYLLSNLRLILSVFNSFSFYIYFLFSLKFSTGHMIYHDLINIYNESINLFLH